jgi:hypothetical protein
MPERLRIPAVDALALRIFLAQRIEIALGIAPKSLHWC